MKGKRTDKIFLFLVVTLLIAGILVFASASLGILAQNQNTFYSIVTNQILLGLLGGLLAMIFFSRIPYRIWKKYALPIFIFSLVLTALVFVPKIGFEHGGAKRWIHFASFSFQPSEFLKFGLILILASWFSYAKEKTEKISYGALPFVFLLGISAAIMLKQPDTGTFIVMAISSLVVYIVAGAPWKHIFSICLIGALGLSLLVFYKPYLKDRLTTFLDPSHDPLGSSYQIKQSLIAIGSGGTLGRGLGQSVQKFSYLPEPVGDSVFAVIGEEAGFAGCVTIILLFILFAMRGLRISKNASDQFGSYLSAGLVSLITAQAFLNISSLIGIFPLTGVPLPFISHGGTALLFTLAEVGIILSISRGSGRG